MKGKISELLNKIQGFQVGVDYTISHGSQGTNYIIQSKELARSLRRILTPETYLSIEGEIIKTEGSYDSGNYYAYQGDSSLASDRLVVGSVGKSNPNLIEEGNLSQTSTPQISEITDEEVNGFKKRGREIIHSSSFPPFSSANQTNDYYRDENRIRQRDFEVRQKELKEQEEKLATERKKLEEEAKNETQQIQQQNFQNRRSQGGGIIPPGSGFWAFVVYVLALVGVFF